MCQYDQTFDLKINVGHCDLISWASDFALNLEDYLMYVQHTTGLWISNTQNRWPIFYGPMILPCIWKTIWNMTSLFWDYDSVWPDIWPQNKCRSLTYISWSSVFACALDFKSIWCMNIIIWSQYDPKFDLRINVGHCYLYFMVQWFCLISWRLFDVRTSLFGIISQCDQKFDLKINIGHCDLYFMVQWFYITTWRLFDVWTSFLGIMGQYDPMFDLKINVGLHVCYLYFMVQWFCLTSPRLFDAWVSYFQIMTQCDPNFDLKVYISHYDLYFMV